MFAPVQNEHVCQYDKSIAEQCMSASAIAKICILIRISSANGQNELKNIRYQQKILQ